MPDVVQITVVINAENDDANKKMNDTNTLLGRMKKGFEQGIGSALAWKAVDGVFNLHGEHREHEKPRREEMVWSGMNC